MTNYTGLRDELTEEFENRNLGAGNQFYYDSGGLNIGFGYNLTAQIGSTPGTLGTTARNALQSVGLTFTNPQWTSIIAAAQNPAATSGPATALNTSVGGAATISQSQAVTLMDNYYSAVAVPGLGVDLSAIGVSVSNVPAQVLVGLDDLKYNANSAISASEVPNLNSSLSSGNWGAAAYDVGFNPITDIFARRDAESMLMLGFDPTINPLNSIESLTPIAANTLELIQYQQLYVQANWSSLGDPNLTIIQSTLIPYLVKQGYYVVQSTDSASNIISTLNSNGMSSGIVDEPTLLRINAPFGVTGISTGALLHVPVEKATMSVSPPAAGYTDVFDTTNAAIYTVGDAVLGGNTSGAFIVDQLGGSGNTLTFAAGTYSGVSISGGNPSVVLTALDGTVLGTLALNVSAGTGALTLLDGAVINLSSIPANAVISDSTGSSETALVSYLTALGDSTTSSALSTTDFNYLNPTGSAYTVTGSVSGSTDTFTSDNGLPGAQITGMSGKTNVLDAEGDVSEDALSNLQQLNLDGNLALTAAELNAFTNVSVNDDTLTVTTGGTVNLGASAFSAGSIADVVATGWGGTTISGDNESDQSLQASLYGNDTLTSGSGTGNILTAGEGIDTLTGSTNGSTTFEAFNGLASGSSATGHSTGNILMANGDLSGATLSGIQTLDITTSPTAIKVPGLRQHSGDRRYRQGCLRRLLESAERFRRNDRRRLHGRNFFRYRQEASDRANLIGYHTVFERGQ